jgi:hypothetical protein
MAALAHVRAKEVISDTSKGEPCSKKPQGSKLERLRMSNLSLLAHNETKNEMTTPLIQVIDEGEVKVKPITNEERSQLLDDEAELPERFAEVGARALPDAYAIRDAYEARLQALEAALEPFVTSHIRIWYTQNDAGNPEITLVGTEPFEEGDSFHAAFRRLQRAANGDGQ